MAENLRRGYARRLVHKSWAEVYQIAPNLHVKGSGLDSDLVLWFDSETHMIYRAQRLEYRYDSDAAWQKDKITYKYYQQGWRDLNANLVVAYDLGSYFTDRKQVYPSSPVVTTDERYWIFDSEGVHAMRPKVAGVGSQRTDFDSESVYIFPYSRLDRVQRRTNFPNQINENFDLFRPEGHVITATGRNFITDSEDRRFYHTDFIGERPPAVWLRTGNTNIGLVGWVDTDSDTEIKTKIASTYDCYGSYASKAFSVNNTTMNLAYPELDRSLSYYFHYMTEHTDSERLVEAENFRTDAFDSDFPSQYLTDSDSRVVTNFTTWDGTEAPWKVFNDSENSGFKASLGVQSGYIGWKEPLTKGYQYNLNYVEIRNTLASAANNRPYDFNIEKMDRYGNWTIIKQVRGFDSYVYSHTFDSEYIGHGFRVNFLQGRPDFDSDVNALEVKQIKFRALREYPDVYRAGHGIFVTTGETDYTFETGDSDLEVSGLLIGAGGGGGDNFSNADPYGAGGGGGGAIQIHSLILPRNTTFRLRVGRGGPANTNGNATTLTDVTNNRVIMSALGGNRGGSANFPTLAVGGDGGQTLVDSDNYVSITTRLNGGRGGDSLASGSNGQAGFAGHKIVMKQFVNTQKMNDLLNTDICAGGGGGANGTPSLQYTGGAAGGASAGRGAGWTAGSTSGSANRGGGGGGAGDQNGRAGASGGGSGYTYLIFK